MLSRNDAVDGMKSHFGNKVLVLLSPGLAKIGLFRSRATKVWKIEKMILWNN